jgi:transporter family-2 protein
MKYNIIYYPLAVLLGAGITLQSAINSELKNTLKTTPVVSSLISVMVGTLFLGSIILFNVIFCHQKIPSISAVCSTSPYKLTGGLFGALFLCGVVLVTPKIGVANTYCLIIAGQVVLSLILDNFGLLGFEKKIISIEKVVGAVLIIAGAFMISCSKK